jgi:lactate dehydrogenase-like 2-hydroxyacid dehydrogenase
MKPGTMLINVSRGGLVDSEALFEGLESGRIGGPGRCVLASICAACACRFITLWHRAVSRA